MSSVGGSAYGALKPATHPAAACKRPLGQKARLEVRRLPLSSFETEASAELPTSGTVRHPEFYQLRSPALKPAVDQYLIVALRLRDGCWLGIPLLAEAGTKPESAIVVIRPPSRSGTTAAPVYTDNRPNIAGYDFVQAFPSYYAGYPSVGLWRSRSRPTRSAIIAFGPRKDGVSSHAVIKVVALDLRAIASIPSPHGGSLGTHAISAPLRDGSVVALSLLWHP
ncbi:MAG: hypothetical protein V4574_14945 [Pseudomonadota bacterium]